MYKKQKIIKYSVVKYCIIFQIINAGFEAIFNLYILNIIYIFIYIYFFTTVVLANNKNYLP